MKKLLLLITLICLSSASFGQCPTTAVLLGTQAEIDNFATNYPGCTILTHELRVDGGTSAITNLNGLSSIISAQDLYVHKTQITDFTGLHNLTDVQNLSVWFNNNIVNLTGLTSLQSSGGLQLFANNDLISMAGIDSLQLLGSLSLFQNSNLNDLTNLSFLETIGFINMAGNNLNTLAGLENLHTVIDDLNIADEPLNDFDSLGDLQTIGGSLYISDLPAVQDLAVFSSIVSLENLFVIGCTSLLDLSGLENVQNVSGTLRIGFNSILTNLAEFNGVTSVGSLDIYENENLLSLNGLENLQTISGRLLIDTNSVLNSIQAIANVSPLDIDEVVIINNTNLSVCDVELICTVISDPSVQKGIVNNSTGCNSIAEVEAACLLSVSEVDLNTSIALYPNPVSEILQINASEGISIEKISLISVLGQHLISTSEENINLSNFSEGIYFVNITTNQGNLTKKIVKQ